MILPACQKLVKVMLGDKAEQDISKIPLSNSTIQKRIINLSDNIEQSVMAELKNCQSARQIDESIDISNHAQLIAFVRFIDEGVISKISLLQEFTLHYKRSRCLTTYLKKHGFILEFLRRNMHLLWLTLTPTCLIMSYGEKWYISTFSCRTEEKDCVDLSRRNKEVLMKLLCVHKIVDCVFGVLCIKFINVYVSVLYRSRR